MTTHSHDYSVTPEALLEALCNDAYLQARNERFAGVGTPTCERSDGSAVIRSTRQLPMDKIPTPVKGLVGDGQITQVDTWSTTPETGGGFTGSWRADLGTAPATIGGEYQIAPTGEGCTYTCSVDVKVKVPFIGGKIEEQVRGYLDRLITKEQEFLADWLEQR